MTISVSNLKLLLLLVCGLLISLHFQGRSHQHGTTVDNDNQRRKDLLAGFSSFQEEDFSNRRMEQRTPVRRDEFWLMDSEEAILPFDVKYTPPDGSFGSLDAMWSCEETSRPKKLVFVNVVRSEAMAVQELLESYAKTCHAGFLSVGVCSGLSWASMISGTWANRRLKSSSTITRCAVQSALSRDGQDMSNGTKVVQSALLKHSVDLLAGQVPLGCADKWPAVQKSVIVEDQPVDAEYVDAQYIVSLRSPAAWFVSNILHKLELMMQSSSSKQQHVNMTTIVEAIHDKVTSDLENGLYHEIFARYLITPFQISWIQKEEADVDIRDRVNLSLSNLKSNNAVIVISERMEESMELIQYLIGVDDSSTVMKQAKRYIRDPADASSIKKVLKELEQDTEFYGKFRDYLKYEKQIYKQAVAMHERQLKWVRKQQLKQGNASSHQRV